jgi:hypothetical protein
MKRITLDQIRDRSRAPSPTLQLDARQRRRRRPRNPDEVRALVEVARARRELWIASGKLEIIGPRRWRYYPGEGKVLAYLGITRDE